MYNICKNKMSSLSGDFVIGDALNKCVLRLCDSDYHKEIEHRVCLKCGKITNEIEYYEKRCTTMFNELKSRNKKALEIINNSNVKEL